MRRTGLKLLVAALAAAGLLSPARAADPPVFDHHEDWNAVLSRLVDDRGRVDYDALAADRAALDRYLSHIAETGPRSAPERFPTEDHELAYYINAYNALAFHGVLDGYLDADSVWGGSGSGDGFFARRKFRLDGESINLRALENEIIRDRFGDARIHAALNCASLGCPRLPTTAFAPDRLDRQLDAAMTEFVSDERHVRVDEAEQTVYLSKIFEWYREDFLADEREAGNADPGLIDYVNRFRDDAPPVPSGYVIRFPDYDKRLNRQPESG